MNQRATRLVLVLYGQRVKDTDVRVVTGTRQGWAALGNQHSAQPAKCHSRVWTCTSGTLTRDKEPAQEGAEQKH
jgi:hypothetical protein